MGDMHDPNELAEFYLANLPPQAEALALAIADHDGRIGGAEESVKRISHQLKGSGSTYGFPEVTDLAEQVLAASGDDLVPAANRLVALLRDLADDTPAVERRILVVDDDRLMQVIIGRIVAADDRTIDYAGTGEEALALVEGADLVLLDLFLPDMDGRDVLRRLRSEHLADDAPVVVLSGADTELARAESLALGADAFVGKPFEQDELRSMVASMLSLGRRRSEPLAETMDTGRSDAGPACVLVAEDDMLVASLVVDRLEREGYEVIHESDGSSALQRIREVHPEVLVLDVKMPKMSGHEVLTRIRRDPDLSSTGVVMLTAMGGEHDVVRGFELGADDYLLKPFSPTELVVRVNRLLESA